MQLSARAPLIARAKIASKYFGTILQSFSDKFILELKLFSYFAQFCRSPPRIVESSVKVTVAFRITIVFSVSVKIKSALFQLRLKLLFFPINKKGFVRKVLVNKRNIRTPLVFKNPRIFIKKKINKYTATGTRF